MQVLRPAIPIQDSLLGPYLTHMTVESVFMVVFPSVDWLLTQALFLTTYLQWPCSAVIGISNNFIVVINKALVVDNILPNGVHDH